MKIRTLSAALSFASRACLSSSSFRLLALSTDSSIIDFCSLEKRGFGLTGSAIIKAMQSENAQIDNIALAEGWRTHQLATTRGLVVVVQ